MQVPENSDVLANLRGAQDVERKGLAVFTRRERGWVGRGKGGGGKMMGREWRAWVMILERLVVVVRNMRRFYNHFHRMKVGGCRRETSC